MRKVIKQVVFLLTIIPFLYAYGSYTTNTTSTIKWLKIYTYNNTIYFALDAPVATACSKNYFVVDGNNMTESLINRHYSALLAAKSSGASVTIGHGTTAGDCYLDSNKVYAVKIND